jgi:hypothetical protein
VRSLLSSDRECPRNKAVALDIRPCVGSRCQNGEDNARL